MKTSRCLSAILTLLALIPLVAQQAQQAFSLNLTVKMETVQVGAEVTLVIVATNKTQQRVPLP